MVARIAGFRTRAELRLRAPRSVSRNITPASGGCAVHWGGPAPRIRNHADCEQTWRNYQAFHMDTRRWSDVAYTAAFCVHGYVLAGRGLGVRTAAQGTNDGNQRFYAFVWIGGVGMRPTQAAYDALDWLVANARQHGAGMAVRPHRSFTGSQCPGDDLVRYAATINGRPISGAPAPAPPPQEDDVTPADINRIADAVFARIAAKGLAARTKDDIARRVWHADVHGKPARNRLHDADVRTGQIRAALDEHAKDTAPPKVPAGELPDEDPPEAA